MELINYITVNEACAHLPNCFHGKVFVTSPSMNYVYTEEHLKRGTLVEHNIY